MENNWKALWKKIKEKKISLKKNQLLILLLVGILLVVISIPTAKGTKTGDEKSEKGTDTVLETGSQGEYEAYLEARVAKTLQYVEGVGKAEVLITLKSTGQKIVEKDQTGSTQTSEETDSTGGTRTVHDSSSDKTSVYEQSGEGGQLPYVSKELSPEIEGVLVIAQGGDNAVVVQNISEAIQALFGVEAHKIKIMKRTDT